MKEIKIIRSDEIGWSGFGLQVSKKKRVPKELYSIYISSKVLKGLGLNLVPRIG